MEPFETNLFCSANTDATEFYLENNTWEASKTKWSNGRFKNNLERNQRQYPTILIWADIMYEVEVYKDVLGTSAVASSVLNQRKEFPFGEALKTSLKR